MKALKRVSVVAAMTLFCLASMGMRWRDQPRPEPRLPLGDDATLTFVEVARFDVPKANQGVGVDEHHFYAVDNAVITKHDKLTGKEVARWEWTGDPAKNPVIHLDGATVSMLQY